jgi:hypothetical protein
MSQNNDQITENAEFLKKNPALNQTIDLDRTADGDQKKNYGAAGASAMDTGLGGGHQTKKLSIECLFSGCGYLNQLSDFDRDYPPQCQNQEPNLSLHLLKWK